MQYDKMKILITGSEGFVGRNLFHALDNIRQGYDRTHPNLSIEKIYCYDIESTKEELTEACANVDFVFHLAGVNRPKDPDEFMRENFGFSSILLEELKRAGNRCPVMLASSVQATLIGRYNSDYGRSKRAGEELFFSYAKGMGAEVLVYRFPNLFGKWCRPNYNSVIATFCHNLANDLPIQVNDPTIEIELLYIDDLISEMLLALEGKAHRCNYSDLTPIFCEDGEFCAVPVTHKVTLGRIAELLYRYSDRKQIINIPNIADGSFEKKLYSTFISYLPPQKAVIPMKKNTDDRGSFTELIRTDSCGQFSVNVSKPGITKGQHWHMSKWEIFVVVSGKGLIRQRRLDSDEIIETEVCGDEPVAVCMLPGYTHSIVNLSDNEDLVTFMWANECFDQGRPDTYFEKL